MDETFSSEVIVLSRDHYREKDLRVSVYSPMHGRMDLVVRGGRKHSSKLAGHLEPLTRSKIMVVRGRNIDYVGGAGNLEAFSGIKNDLEPSMAAGRAVYVFRRMVGAAEPDSGIYSHLLDFLREMKSVSRVMDPELLADIFILRLLNLLGYGPRLDHCPKCRDGSGAKVYNFDISGGGIICADCNTRRSDNRLVFSLEKDMINALRRASEFSIAKASRMEINPGVSSAISKIIGNFVKYHHLNDR